MQLLLSTLRISTPLLFAALGGLLCERSGVVNIALEGMMLIGAFGAAVGTLKLHSAWCGSLCGAGAGVSFAALYGLFALRWRANQVVAGMAINMLAFGLTPLLCKMLYDVTGSTPQIPYAQRFHSAPLYLVWLSVGLCYLWLKYTRAGLRLQFAGENPEALDVAGVRVGRTLWLAVLAGGLLAGLGGATLSIFLASSFSRDMSAGRGFIALAALIFGKWKPVPVAMACLLFGFADAAQIRLQSQNWWGLGQAPAQLVQVLPYLITVLVLAGLVGNAKPPKALGMPFKRE